MDLRGHGDSEGVPTNEYSETELADGVEVVARLAAQPWCTGRVGMFGISWGGFNSRRIAYEVSSAPGRTSTRTAACRPDRREEDARSACFEFEVPEETWDARVETVSAITCDGQDFITSDEVVRKDGDEVVFHRTWEKRIPRTAG